jgi:hypothetical protein
LGASLGKLHLKSPPVQSLDTTTRTENRCLVYPFLTTSGAYFPLSSLVLRREPQLKDKTPLFPTLLAVCGAALAMYGGYVLETLSMSSTETALVHGIDALIAGCFFAAMAYARSLLGERPEPAPSAEQPDE